MLASKLTVMFTQANTRSSTERFDLEVRKLQSICELHKVRTGGPKDFAGFMRKLATDRHFAMDFWAFIGPLSSRERGELSDEQMLAIIVESVTGGAVPEDDPNLKRLVDDLGNLLAGIDVQSMPGFSEVETVPFTRSESGLPTSPDSGGDVNGNIQSISTAADAGSISSAVADLSPSSSVPQLNEALLRLESMSLELRQYMDAIETRLGKLGPHLEERAANVTVPKEPVRTPVEERSYAANEGLGLKLATGSRLVLEPPEPAGRNTNDPPLLIPLESYSKQGSHRGFVWFVVLLALAIGGVSAHKYNGPLKERFGALVQKMRSQIANDKVANDKVANDQATSDQATSTGQSVPQQTVAASVPPAAVSNGGSSANPPPAHDTAATRDTPSAHDAAVAPASAGGAAGGALASVPAQAVAVRPRARIVPSREEPVEIVESPLTPDEANAIKVPPSVMQGNLVVSRLAAYPEIARANHVEGSVVVETIISKGGMVDHVHAIKGDPMLRSAAEEAVRKWRYRPYLLNGVPVEVATTVTVDFKLNR